jgi:cbb3-type cytochrome oxidase subunit 3
MTLMTVGLIRGALTVILFAAFIALWIWAWSKHRQAEFDAAARLPFEDDAPAIPPTANNHH